MQNELINLKIENLKKRLAKCLEIPKIELDSKNCSYECTLSRRLTPQNVVDNFINNLDSIFNKCINDIETLKKDFTDDMRHVINVDRLLGEYTETNQIEDVDQVELIKKSKDGTMRFHCPMSNCGARVFKLIRHLKNHELTYEQVKFAAKISNIYMRNNKVSYLKPKEYLEDFDNKKLNYKYCIICKSLILNLCNHLYTTHGLMKHDSEYQNAMTSTTVVPACMVKKSGKVNRLMSQNEIENYESNGSKIIFAKSLLEKLNSIRNEMSTKISKKFFSTSSENMEIDSSPNVASTTSIQTSNVILSNSVAPNFKELRIMYTKYLERLNRPNIPKIIRTTFYIVNEYSKRHSISSDQILKPKFIGKLLSDFIEKPGLTSTMKIKYIYNLEALLQFLVKDSSSPFFIDGATNETIISNNLEFEQVRLKISNYRKTLSKDRGKERMAAKEKRHSSLITVDHDSSAFVKRLNGMENVEEMSKSERLSYRDNFINLCFARMGNYNDVLIIYILLLSVGFKIIFEE